MYTIVHYGCLTLSESHQGAFMKEMYCTKLTVSRFLFIFILWATNIRHSEQAQINTKFNFRPISQTNKYFTELTLLKPGFFGSLQTLPHF